MQREAMAKTAQLSDFDEELYKVTEDANNEKTDKYLIGQSSQRRFRAGLNIVCSQPQVSNRSRHFTKQSGCKMEIFVRLSLP